MAVSVPAVIAASILCIPRQDLSLSADLCSLRQSHQHYIAKIVSDIAEMQQALRPQHDASSAEHRGSDEPGSSQKQEAPPGRTRFTWSRDQDMVAEALMRVMEDAERDSKHSVFGVKWTLEANNPATVPFLTLLPDCGPFPEMAQIKQGASDQLLRNLTKLANQCAAAQCQPMEVFARSTKCSAHMGQPNEDQVTIGAYDWELLKEQQRMPQPPSVSQDFVEVLQRQGVQRSMADLAVAFSQVAKIYSSDEDAAPYAKQDLEQMLPGGFQRSIQHRKALRVAGH